MRNEYPNLFIPGAAKSGTSTLHDLLDLHPEIRMSSTKEPSYWTHKNFDSFDSTNKQKYLDEFSSELMVSYKGESSTAYMCFPHFIERIKAEHIKNLKFIFVLRNPIDRIYSHYWYLKGLGSETLSLKEAILRDMDIEPGPNHMLREGKYKNYYQFGLYGKWMSRFYEAFDPNQIKIILFENLQSQPKQTLNSCFIFLGLEELDSIPEIQTNKTKILKQPSIYKHVIKTTNIVRDGLRPTFKYLPRFLKESIKKISVSDAVIKALNTEETYPQMGQSERDWLRELYTDDVDTLKMLCDQNFNEWHDFN